MRNMQQTAAANGAVPSYPTSSSQSQPQPNYVPIPIPIPQSQKSERKPDVIEELMKKMFMRKVMQKFFDQRNEENDDEGDGDDFFGVEDDEKFAEMLFFSKNKNRNRFVSLVFLGH